MTPARKKIIITMIYMHIGGAERSLLGMLHAMDYTKYDVDLFLFSHEGEFMNMIPPQVNLLPEIPAYKSLIQPLAILKKNSLWLYLLKKLAIITACIHYRCSGRKPNEHGITQYCERFLLPFLPSINTKPYDLAISFLSYHNIISDKLSAAHKLGWYHNDYHQAHPFLKSDFKTWNRLNGIIHVSESALSSFIHYHPALKHKAYVIENILSANYVRKQAQIPTEDFHRDPNQIYLLTVGRLCEQKAYDRAIEACYMLHQKGYNIQWNVIGEGHLEQNLKQKVEDLGLNQKFLFLGPKSNPYPYIELCDIYVQPSNFEGKSVSVREAQILKKPVVVTNYSTASSQINNGIDGIITDMSAEAVAQAIGHLINQPELREKLSHNCAARDYGNEQEINHIYHAMP